MGNTISKVGNFLLGKGNDEKKPERSLKKRKFVEELDQEDVKRQRVENGEISSEDNQEDDDHQEDDDDDDHDVEEERDADDEADLDANEDDEFDNLRNEEIDLLVDIKNGEISSEDNQEDDDHQEDDDDDDHDVEEERDADDEADLDANEDDEFDNLRNEEIDLLVDIKDPVGDELLVASGEGDTINNKRDSIHTDDNIQNDDAHPDLQPENEHIMTRGENEEGTAHAEITLQVSIALQRLEDSRRLEEVQQEDTDEEHYEEEDINVSESEDEDDLEDVDDEDDDDDDDDDDDEEDDEEEDDEEDEDDDDYDVKDDVKNIIHRFTYLLGNDIRSLMLYRSIFNGIAKNTTTALHISAWLGHETLALRLLKKGRNVDVNARDIGGRTALHMAAWKGHSEIIQILLEHGAHPRVISRQAATPLAIALQEGHNDCIKILATACGESEQEKLSNYGILFEKPHLW
ncbi:coiled-coil domain-containing protein 1-like [Nilaparvata lugens]|uniref:coiled-coil domain-containing protein 1-like n=1 Tax=Nilaparvata lugens TaxID=108931 RepID=UPI00193DAB77|nr:coiled-coil domain-containing protein 1-like [Nilaparvata lugens]